MYYPSYIAPAAKTLLEGLLQRDPAGRLGSGSGDVEELMVEPFFERLSWERLLQKKVKPPWMPKVRLFCSAGAAAPLWVSSLSLCLSVGVACVLGMCSLWPGEWIAYLRADADGSSCNLGRCRRPRLSRVPLF